MRRLVSSIFILFCSTACAVPFDLDGQMFSADGHQYSVSIKGNHQYSGDATDIGNGAFNLALQDENGRHYSGTATQVDGHLYDYSLNDGVAGTLTLVD